VLAEAAGDTAGARAWLEGGGAALAEDQKQARGERGGVGSRAPPRVRGMLQL
jgi:hypothetical protein